MKIAVNNKHPLTLKYKHDRFGKHGKLDKHSKQNTKIQALANISFLMLASGIFQAGVSEGSRYPKLVPNLLHQPSWVD